MKIYIHLLDALLSENSLQIYATIWSGSIAIVASTLDSLLDLMAGRILWFTHLYMKRGNIYKYPIGKLRVQPVGIIVFAVVMATLGFQALCKNDRVDAAHKLFVKMSSKGCPPDVVSYTTMVSSLCKVGTESMNLEIPLEETWKALSSFACLRHTRCQVRSTLYF
ncbi:metal tolerance protein 4-like isoform X4 [Benincasa hispida]|uniref:metal tolerance protein 4-like isoform X4 n=1 Tax=Benincasa hispida TaxID=102211 RepID=UPI0018FF6728|nr:metal tolerance protein 4-like isoform X4 [Benincasa hispida]